jgi:hypothetical protein
MIRQGEMLDPYSAADERSRDNTIARVSSEMKYVSAAALNPEP